MPGFSQNPREKPTDLQNVAQGDDSNQGLNTTLNNTAPSDFAVPGGSTSDPIDFHNNGDHDATGRFDPYGGFPNYGQNQPGDPTFTRQTAPLMGHYENFQDPVEPQVPEQAHTHVSKLGTKREDEPDENIIGLDPSQDNFHKNSIISRPKDFDNNKMPPENLKSKQDPSTTGPFQNENLSKPPKKCFKLNFRQPLKLNSPAVFVYGLEQMGVKYLVMSAAGCLYLGKSGYGITSLLVMTVIGALAFYMLSTSTLKSLDWQIEKLEGAQILSRQRDGETMEWFNVVIEKVWRCIDPQVFAVVEDILEDTISRVTPKAIKAVKVCDFDLGVESPRIEKINIFPSKSGQPSDSIFGEAIFTLGMDRNDTHTTSHKPQTSSAPGVSIRFKTRINTALDIRGELTKLSGKIRFKIITAPEPPFVKRVTISFLKAPEIETAVMPISKRLNIMRLPMLKTAVDQGVKLGFKSLVDPKSITIDIPPIMIGVQIDTNAIGVVKAEIRGARNLHSATGGAENSFVTFSLSDRPDSNIKSTRILSKNENPIWDENLYQLVTIEDITKDVYLNLKVWDADKLHSDKLWGSMSISTKDTVLATLDEYNNVSSWYTEERVIFDGWAPIDGKSETDSEIHLNFRLSFHPKYLTPVPTPSDHAKTKKSKKEKAKQKREEKAKKELEKLEKKKQKMMSNTHYTVKKLDDNDMPIKDEKVPNLENGAVTLVSDETSEIERTELVTYDHEESYTYDGSLVEDDSSDDDKGEPVSPLHVSGILSVKIVQAKDLEIIDPEVIYFKKRIHPYTSNKSVSPYAELYIDDNKVFRTRTKMKTSNPNWNAVSECFLKNYETAYIRVSVKTNIDLEENPVIGTSILKISDLFRTKSKKSKESIKWVSLSNGIGYGKVLLDLKYKPLKLILPRQLRGADVGTLVIDSIQLVDIRSPMRQDRLFITKAAISINVSPKITRDLSPDLLNRVEDRVGWFRSKLYFPVMMRYRSGLSIHLFQGSGRKTTARLWMKEIYDHDWQEISLALRPYTDQDPSDEVPWGQEGPSGRILVRLKFVPGFSPVHTELPEFNVDMLGADPFQNDDIEEKAHLLVRQEGTESYAIEHRTEKDKEKGKEALASPEQETVPPLKINPSIQETTTPVKSDSPTTIQKTFTVQATDSPIQTTATSATAQKDSSIEEAQTTSPVEKKAPPPMVLDKPDENEEGGGGLVTNTQSYNAEGRRTSGSSAVTFNDRRKASTSSNTFILSDKTPSSSIPVGQTFTKRPSDIKIDKRISVLSGATLINNEGTSHGVGGGTIHVGDKLSQLVEGETVEYLESMQDNLRNTKIKKRKILRKFAKGKDVILKKVSSFRNGYNSQARANKAVVEEA